MEWYVYVLIILGLYLLRKYLKGPFSKHRKSMKGKTVIITGASAGIGKESALQLLEDGADVILATRDKNKTQQILDSLTAEHKSRAHWIHLDLCSLKSVDNFVKEFKSKFEKLDVLMNNAGGFPTEFVITDDGIESWIQANHISHMYLTALLLEWFDKTEGRIINVSSMVHADADYTEEKIKQLIDDKDNSVLRKYYTNIMGRNLYYSNTKIANVFFTSYLAEVLEAKYPHIKTFTLHPGVVATEFLRFLGGYTFVKYLFMVLRPAVNFFMKTPIAGAQTQLDLCYRNLGELENGGYFKDCGLSGVSKLAKDKKARDLFIEYSYGLIRGSGRSIEI
jgi:retinol dehydrogenase-12